MLFEDDYNRIIYDRIAEVVRNQDGIFASKEDFLSQFCDWHKVEVTMKTFNKWLEKCRFEVLDQVEVVDNILHEAIPSNLHVNHTLDELIDEGLVPQPVAYGVPRSLLSLSDEEAFDNETKEDLL